jgi:hypothetical protein
MLVTTCSLIEDFRRQNEKALHGIVGMEGFKNTEGANLLYALINPNFKTLHNDHFP